MSGQSAFGKFREELDIPVFVIEAGGAGLAVLAFALVEDAATETMNDINQFLCTNLGWAYLLVMFVLFLIFGPWGNIKLGDEDEEPEFTFLAYFAMLYSAGIAAGIVFWGPAEAIFHYDAVSPFVGLFIARISRGRTVRQVAVAGVIASTGITIPWFATMGGTAIFLQENGRTDILSVVSELGEGASGYPLFEALPLGGLLTVLFLVLVTTFLVTSADSSTLALGMLTTGGAERPSTINRVIWGFLIGALASLLMVAGGVDALQAAAIITGGPFALVTLLAVASMILTFGRQRSLFLREEDEVDVPASAEVIEGGAQDD